MPFSTTEKKEIEVMIRKEIKDFFDSTSSKLYTVRTGITKNDVMSIKSFITLPEPVIRFSKINLPGSSILEKANLNMSFLNYWRLLKKNTTVNTTFIDNFETGFEFNEQNFANNIKNFTLNLSEQDTRGMTRTDIYNKFVKTIVPKTKILFNKVEEEFQNNPMSSTVVLPTEGKRSAGISRQVKLVMDTS